MDGWLKKIWNRLTDKILFQESGSGFGALPAGRDLSFGSGINS